MIEISGNSLRVRRRDKRGRYVLLGVFVMIFLFTFMSQRFKGLEEEADAASLAGFDPGYIISDYQMGNYNSMSEADIQNFLWSKGRCYNTNFGSVGTRVDYFSDVTPPTTWHVKDGHTVCLAEENMNGETAAHIIWQTAQDYRINPQVLIVLLQKETGMITDPIPNSWDYQRAAGYGCPDTAACSSKYYGFKNQIRNAAALFRTVLDGGWTNYPLGDNYIQYNPNSGCGGSVVTIRSLATSALYRYTPYQPNAGALAAGYGTAYCGAYGNRNFYLYFEDWFGGVTSESRINEYYISVGGENGFLGTPVNEEKCGLVKNGCYRVFKNGYVYWNKEHGVHALFGPIFDQWFKSGTEWGYLGYPIGDKEELADGGIKQKFEGGEIYWTSATGAYDVSGGIYTEWGVLGYPTSGEQKDSNGTTYQTFENGVIYWKRDTGAWMITNFARDRWISLGGENSKLGEVKNDGVCGLVKSGCYQAFSTGNIYWTSATEWGVLGYPTSGEQKDSNGTTYQTFENGVIYWNGNRGATVQINGF